MNTTVLANHVYTSQDLQAVTDLLNLCDQTYKLEDGYTSEELKVEFEHPRIDPEKDLRVWKDETGRIVGFGQLWREDPEEVDFSAYLYMRVHPEFEKTQLADEIIVWAENVVKQESQRLGLKGRLDGSERDFFNANREAYERNGYRINRYFFRMRRDLSEPIPPLDFPTGYTLTNVKTKEDAVKWVDALNHSFIDHWNFHPAKIEDHLHWLQVPHYRPEHDLVAIAPDDTFGGICFCVVDPAEIERSGEKRGWIGTLGTTRAHRKIGLGRAMLLAGLHHLKECGLDWVLLGVDAENPSGALGFYERYGFVRNETTVAYRKEF